MRRGIKYFLVAFLMSNCGFCLYAQQIPVGNKIPLKTYKEDDVIDPDCGIIIYDKLNFFTGGDSVRNASNGLPVQGWIYDYYSNGMMLHRGLYDNGQLKSYKNYYDNGQVEREFDLLDDDSATVKIFRKDGEPKSEIDYHKGVPVREQNFYIQLSRDSSNKVHTGVQQTYSLEIKSTDNSSLLKRISYRTRSESKAERIKDMQGVLLTLYDNAYLAATFDSLITDSLKLTAYLHIGVPYKWAHLSKGNVDELALTEAGFREKIYFGKKLNYKEVRTVLEKIIVYYEDNGYPFAAVRLDSVKILDNAITATMRVDKKKLVKIDSLIVKGSSAISLVYLQSYIGIKRGDAYNESRVRTISSKLRNLPFLREKRPLRVLFTEKETKLILELENKKASQFDGIIGFLPDATTGKLAVTGNVNLKLQNKLDHGELIDLTWQSLPQNTQDLKLELTYPFLFSLPFGIDYNFKLYKLDTTYLDVYNNLGIQYLLKGGNYIKVFYANKISSLLTTSQLADAVTLPDYANVTTNSYGLGLKLEKLDYRLNPRKGYSLVSDVSIGEKVIAVNPNLNPVLYTNLTLHSLEYSGDVNAALYVPIVGKSILKFGIQSAFVSGPSLFLNDMYHIGGLNSLRGFDEQSIYASTYAIGTVEYRFLMEQNAFIHLFFDQAWYENNSVGIPYVHDTPYGFGTGINFETKAGIFSLDYALGSQFGNPIYLKDGKIHFGIVSYF
jgi:outer membrane protein assembly factor BamA